MKLENLRQNLYIHTSLTKVCALARRGAAWWEDPEGGSGEIHYEGGMPLGLER
jgi:hypothetical protein